ncbi:hypothetical protein [Rhodanobacter aciditrophus]|uniref:hypothetical protein n=1 Tax=Rhodanobacter aciditrophus TaxID=1623218 RepID=UPI00366E6B9D
MPHDLIVSLSIILVVVFVALVVAVSLLRFFKLRRARQQQEIEALVKRCHRIDRLLNIVPDRYLPLITKTVLMEYMVSSVSLIKKHREERELVGALPHYLQSLSELKAGQQATLKDRVQTSQQLELIQNALQSLPLLLRGLVGKSVLDKATAKEQAAQIRFGYFLAHHDLLVREARLDLDIDKKARALEKLRLALAEMEKVAAYTASEPVIKRLNKAIKQVESELFGKKARVD